MSGTGTDMPPDRRKDGKGGGSFRREDPMPAWQGSGKERADI